jgi:transcriptional regulator with XRE-family HTH domain
MSTQPSNEHIPVWTAGDRFRKAREDAGLTQTELADAIGVDRKTISAYELDDRKRPMKMVVNAWAMRCSVPVSWLLTGKASQPTDGQPAHLLMRSLPPFVPGVAPTAA